MIAREIIILVGVLVGFAASVGAYLTRFHGEAGIKEVLSTTFAATMGMYVGRIIERSFNRG